MRTEFRISSKWNFPDPTDHIRAGARRVCDHFRGRPHAVLEMDEGGRKLLLGDLAARVSAAKSMFSCMEKALLLLGALPLYYPSGTACLLTTVVPHSHILLLGIGALYKVTRVIQLLRSHEPQEIRWPSPCEPSKPPATVRLCMGLLRLCKVSSPQRWPCLTSPAAEGLLMRLAKSRLRLITSRLD